MRKHPPSQAGIFTPRLLLAVILCSLAFAGLLSLLAQAPNPSCLNAPSQVVTDPTGDQGAANPPQVDIQSISIGEDYRFIANPRLVLIMKVANLNSIPPNQFWRVRFTFTPSGGTATVYQINMTSDANSIVNYDYGTVANSMVTTLGGIESGSYATDGTITLVINMNKVGNPSAGSILTAVNGLTQQNNGGVLFTGEDSTASSNYTVRAQDAACTPVLLPPLGGTATYTKGGMTFSANYATKAPYIGQDVEPSVRCDKFGNCYVAPIRGVPGGTDLFYFDLRPTVNGLPNPTYDPFMRNPIYRGQPDKIADIPGNGSVGGDGGGDVDMAVGFNSEATENASSPPMLAYSSLVLANISTQRSTDRGATFVKNPLGNVTGGVPGDDRQWMEFFGNQYVYLIYRTLAPAVAQVQRSVDGGLTYADTTVVGTIGQVGGVDVDQNDGTVYLSGSSGVVAVGIPPVPGPPSPTSLPPTSYTIHSVASSANAHLFFTVKVASDGTVYACYSDDHNVFIKFSQDKGNTWSSAIRVSDGPETLTSVFPWVETGPTPGTIGVVWYGTNKATTGDDTADWHVFYAQGTTVTTSPSFRQVEASDHVIHGANISEAGLVVGGMSPNRNLADYFQIAFDPTGAAVIAYCDDHNDISGHTYVARQISGPGVNGGAAIPSPVEGPGLPAQLFEPKPTAASVGGLPGSQVTDHKDDVRTGGNPQTGGTVVVPTDDPLDILSIKYSAEGTSAQPVLVATMKVSDLTTIPPDSNWRMNFTANAPTSVLSPTGEFTFGTSDRGDQFFVRATTDSAGAQTFIYGTATRNFDGTITYTDKGSADSGAFNQTDKTITVKVAVSKLNSALVAGHTALANGSVLVGLRGVTFTTVSGSGNNRTDTARGGTQFQISFPVQLTSVVSRKTHTGVGDFDVNLPLIGTPGVECRSGGTNGDYKLVFTFPNNLMSVAGASVTGHNPASGTGTVSSSLPGPNLNQYTVNLTNVSNAQYITVTLTNVVDTAGNSGNVVGPQMNVLLGDVDATGLVDGNDVSAVQGATRQPVASDTLTFREDVNCTGLIDGNDVSITQGQTRASRPANLPVTNKRKASAQGNAKPLDR